MAIGAIQAIKEIGLKPDAQIKVISSDGVLDIFKAMINGEANATVKLTSNIAGSAFDALPAIIMKKDGKAPPKFIQTDSRLLLLDTAKQEYDAKQSLNC